MTCTFFGHRNCPEFVKSRIEAVIEELILKGNADIFYVGNNGNFDMYVYSILKELKLKYPYISCYVVLAYIPEGQNKFLPKELSDTIVPDGIEKTPKRFAISYRNKWMIERSDLVIAYVCRPCGGAARFLELAKKKNKICINIAE